MIIVLNLIFYNKLLRTKRRGVGGTQDPYIYHLVFFLTMGGVFYHMTVCPNRAYNLPRSCTNLLCKV